MTQYHRPFLKWPGGKFRLLKHVCPQLPRGDLLIEPFVGAGAIFLNVDYEQYWLNDINSDLIGLYKILKKQGKPFIEKSKSLFTQRNNKEKRYYAIREQFNNSEDLEERALLFLYLNRHGYNGLCRYNKQGKYNVPFGSYKKPYFPEKEFLHFLSRASRIKFFNTDFKKVMKKSLSTSAKTVIYCDPPYIPLSKTSNFTSYSGNDFGIQCQHELAELAALCAQEGQTVVISNHDHPIMRDLYKQAELITLKVQRAISCHAQKRLAVNELMAIFRGG